jgi:hypothetical protein
LTVADVKPIAQALNLAASWGEEGILKLFENDCGAVDVSLLGGQI